MVTKTSITLSFSPSFDGHSDVTEWLVEGKEFDGGRGDGDDAEKKRIRDKNGKKRGEKERKKGGEKERKKGGEKERKKGGEKERKKGGEKDSDVAKGSGDGNDLGWFVLLSANHTDNNSLTG